MIIARLTAELRCYVPYLPEGPWARLRHLGARRDGLVSRATAAREQLRGLLECAWPAVLETAAGPPESLTWRAALAVSADPAVIAAMSEQEFLAALREQTARPGRAESLAPDRPGEPRRELALGIPTVVDIDTGQPSIYEARDQVSGQRVEYLVGDFLEYPFGNESFDFIASVATLHHIDATAALTRIRTLLRPGGVMAILGLARSRLLRDLAFELAGLVAHRTHSLTRDHLGASGANSVAASRNLCQHAAPCRPSSSGRPLPPAFALAVLARLGRASEDWLRNRLPRPTVSRPRPAWAGSRGSIRPAAGSFYGVGELADRRTSPALMTQFGLPATSTASRCWSGLVIGKAHRSATAAGAITPMSSTPSRVAARRWPRAGRAARSFRKPS